MSGRPNATRAAAVLRGLVLLTAVAGHAAPARAPRRPAAHKPTAAASPPPPPPAAPLPPPAAPHRDRLWRQLQAVVSGGRSVARQRRLLGQELALLGPPGRRSEPELWRAAATAQLLLGRPAAALPWFALGWQQQPTDWLWLADWADGLERSSRSGAARAVRRLALAKLRPLARQAAHRQPSERERETLLTFLGLLGEERRQAGATWLAWLGGQQLEPALLHELRTLWQHPATLRSAARGAPRLLARLALPSAESPPLTAKATPPTATSDDDEDDDDEDDDDDDDLQAAAAAEASDDEDDEDDDPASREADTATVNQQAAADVADEGDTSLSAGYAATVGVELQGLGGLLITATQARADLAWHHLGLTLRAGWAELHESQGWVDVEDIGLHRGEGDLALQGRWLHSKGKLELTVGGNFRALGSLAYAALRTDYEPLPGLTVALDLGLNQLAADTSALRLLGARDRAMLTVAYDLTQREFFSAVVDWHRYGSRQRDLLANGYTLYAEAGHRLLLKNPGWSVRVSGYFEQNRLADALPDHLLALLADENTTVSEFVVPDFAMVGVGSTLRRGLPGVAPRDGQQLRYFVDVWLGYLWPLHELGYDLQAGLGLSGRRTGELSLSGFVANSRQSGGSEGFSWGANLRYVY